MIAKIDLSYCGFWIEVFCFCRLGSRVKIRIQKRLVSAVSVAGILLFIVTVWPTIYRYDHVNLKGTVLPVRINRVSGKTEILQGMRGWIQVAENERDNATTNHKQLQPQIVSFPPEELVKVTGNAGLFLGALFEGKLYNGSNWHARELILTITAREKNGSIRWSRQYKDKIFIGPLETGNFQVEIVGGEGADLSWTIDDIRGYVK